jgi:hypothetical protein
VTGPKADESRPNVLETIVALHPDLADRTPPRGPADAGNAGAALVAPPSFVGLEAGDAEEAGGERGEPVQGPHWAEAERVPEPGDG